MKFKNTLSLMVGVLLTISGVSADNGVQSSDNAIMCTMEYAPVCGVDGKTYGNKCMAQAQEKISIAYEGECKAESELYGKITKIESGKDGKQIYVTDNSGIEYNTAISIISDIIKNGKLSDLLLGTRVKIIYYEKDDSSNLLIGDKIEIISKGLSENDESFYKIIQDKLDSKYQDSVDNVVSKYIKLIEKYSLEKKQKINNLMVEKLDAKISKFLKKYPQDIALPVDANNTYMTLELLKLELMKLDFYK